MSTGNPLLDDFMIEIRCNRAKYAAACSCLDLARFHELVLAVAGKPTSEVEKRHKLACCASGGGGGQGSRNQPVPVPIPGPVVIPIPTPTPKQYTKEECVQMFLNKACSPTAREVYRTLIVVGPLLAAGRDGKVAAILRALGKLGTLFESACSNLESADPVKKAAAIALAGTLMCVSTYLFRMRESTSVKFVFDILFPLMPVLRPILNEWGLMAGQACCNTTDIGPILGRLGLPELEVIGE